MITIYCETLFDFRRPAMLGARSVPTKQPFATTIEVFNRITMKMYRNETDGSLSNLVFQPYSFVMIQLRWHQGNYFWSHTNCCLFASDCPAAIPPPTGCQRHQALGRSGQIKHACSTFSMSGPLPISPSSCLNPLSLLFLIHANNHPPGFMLHTKQPVTLAGKSGV